MKTRLEVRDKIKITIWTALNFFMGLKDAIINIEKDYDLFINIFHTFV
jgi:hypothetical protein